MLLFEACIRLGRAEQYLRPYLDADVFLAWIKGEIVNNVERKSVVAHVLSQAQQGLFKVHTSTLTLAEVHTPRKGPGLSDELGEKILAFFGHDFIWLIDVIEE